MYILSIYFSHQLLPLLFKKSCSWSFNSKYYVGAIYIYFYVYKQPLSSDLMYYFQINYIIGIFTIFQKEAKIHCLLLGSERLAARHCRFRFTEDFGLKLQREYTRGTHDLPGTPLISWKPYASLWILISMYVYIGLEFFSYIVTIDLLSCCNLSG